MLDKTCSFSEIEAAWYARWQAEGAFAAGRHPQAQPYTIVIPPPNVTGSLHMGHALNNTLQDILIRRARMQGRDALWQPGTDHAGIATQMVVERRLATEGLGRRDLGRERFIERVWQWKAESGGTIVGQLKRLGASCDWSRERFTMDDGLSAAVRKVFVELHRQGLIYRDKRLVNWDPLLHTAISDLEVESREVRGKLWTIRYPVEGEQGRFLAVATTRPETMLGDTAVAVHPDDPRFADLIGRRCLLPIAGRAIPIVADPHADPEKGTGAVKITPAHDFNDFEVGRRHGLPMINVLDGNAAMLAIAEVPERFHGLDRYEARDAIVAELQALGLLAAVEDHTLMMPYGDRSGVVVEPWLMDQWFVDAKKLANDAIEAVEESDTEEEDDDDEKKYKRFKFVPSTWKKTYLMWMQNIQPWCISRQIWWGHQIPAWYGPDGYVFVKETEEEANAEAAERYGHPTELERDPDVLDTWFSSALWPFSTLGWPEKTPELARYYPTDVLITGFDIIFFWVARMMMMGLHFLGKVPFRTVYVHALVRDEKGQKMSKSKGNVIDPLQLIDKYGADALRFTLTALAVQGRDVKLSEARVAGYRNFATKLWNAARFCQMNGALPVAGFDPGTCQEPVNRWLVLRTQEAALKANQALEHFHFNLYAETLYHFTWGTFCDWYLEFAKPMLTGGDAAQQAETRAAAGWALDRILALLHPVMPFVTEELYQALGDRGGRLLINGPWPVEGDELEYPVQADSDWERQGAEIDWVVRLITQVRAVRAELNVPPGARVPLLLKDADDAARARLARYHGLITTLARLSSAEPLIGSIPAGAVEDAMDGATLVLPIADVIDIAAERSRLGKEIGKLDTEIERTHRKLSNPNFRAKAAPEVVEAEEERWRQWGRARRRLEQALRRLAAL